MCIDTRRSSSPDRHLLKTIAMGQVLSLLICGTAVSCQYLAKARVETPMLQSFLNYALLLLVYVTVLVTRQGQDASLCSQSQNLRREKLIFREFTVLQWEKLHSFKYKSNLNSRWEDFCFPWTGSLVTLTELFQKSFVLKVPSLSHCRDFGFIFVCWRCVGHLFLKSSEWTKRITLKPKQWASRRDDNSTIGPLHTDEYIISSIKFILFKTFTQSDMWRYRFVIYNFGFRLWSGWGLGDEQCSIPGPRRWSEHRSDFKNQLVEVSGDGSGRRGGKLHSCEGVPVHHPDKHTGKKAPWFNRCWNWTLSALPGFDINLISVVYDTEMKLINTVGVL